MKCLDLLTGLLEPTTFFELLINYIYITITNCINNAITTPIAQLMQVYDICINNAIIDTIAQTVQCNALKL